MSQVRNFEEPTYESIQEERKTALRPLPPSLVSKAIGKESKSGAYELAEELFQYLLQIFKYKTVNKPNYYYSELDVIAIQRSISSLVRYAPTPERARYYFNYALGQLEEPVLSLTFEITILNNLLYVHTLSTDEDQMKEALEILKASLEVGVFQSEIPASFAQQNTRFNDPLEVFETLSRKVLRYFKLEFNEEKTALRPAQRLFSH